MDRWLDFKSDEEFAWAILHGEHHFGDNWRQLRQWGGFIQDGSRGKGGGTAATLNLLGPEGY